MLKLIHVNPKIHFDNQRDGTARGIVSVKTDRGTRWFSTVEIQGPSRVVYSPRKPLDTGAVCWIETEADVLGDGVLVK